MSDDLVNRLHEEALTHSPSYNICNEAADRIEKLEAALREIAGAKPECCVITDAIQYIARKALDAK